MTPTQFADFHAAYHHFAGFDWARDAHDVVLVDQHGQLLEQFQFEDSAQGWSILRQRIAPYAQLAVTGKVAAIDSVRAIFTCQRHARL